MLTVPHDADMGARLGPPTVLALLLLRGASAREAHRHGPSAVCLTTQ